MSVCERVWERECVCGVVCVVCVRERRHSVTAVCFRWIFASITVV